MRVRMRTQARQADERELRPATKTSQSGKRKAWQRTGEMRALTNTATLTKRPVPPEVCPKLMKELLRVLLSHNFETMAQNQ